VYFLIVFSIAAATVISPVVAGLALKMWVLCYPHECNFVFAPRKSLALPAVGFMKLTNAHKYYAQIFYMKFHPN